MKVLPLNVVDYVEPDEVIKPTCTINAISVLTAGTEIIGSLF